MKYWHAIDVLSPNLMNRFLQLAAVQINDKSSKALEASNFIPIDWVSKKYLFASVWKWKTSITLALFMNFSHFYTNV